MKLRIFAVVVCIQVIGITILFIHIQNKRNSTLGVSINTIDPNTIQGMRSGDLKYFYEPLANTVDEVHRDWLTYISKYTINSDSLNERFDYSVNKDPGTFRIITLGDSFTFGANVSTAANWTELLEKELGIMSLCKKEKFEVINLGMGGYDPTYETERFVKRGKKYNADLILMFLTDPYRDTEAIINLAKSYDKSFEDDKDGTKAWARAYGVWRKSLDTNKMREKQMKALIRLRSEYAGQIIIILMKKRTNMYVFKYVFDFIENYSNTKIVEIINTIENQNLRFNNHDIHPNKEGHKKIMEEILEYLTKNNLIPCTP